MILFLAWIGFVSVCSTGETRFKRQESSCVTPNGATGNCVSIRTCEALLPLLRRANQDAEAANFLRKSKCGGYAEVCCPSERKTTGIKGQPLLVDGCGVSNVTQQNRVVNGVPAWVKIHVKHTYIGAWPWIAALGYRSVTRRETQWRCGGSLINKRYVLTAAHCIRTPPSLFLNLATVRLGEHDLSSTSDGASPVDYGIEKSIVHDDYRSQSNDIALIRLDKDVRFTDKIKPICLPQPESLINSNFVKKYPFVVGWGETSLDGPSSDVLLQVQVPVVDNESCRTAYVRHGATITSSQLCAGEQKGRKDSCRGDSGGPLMLPQTGVYYQIGIISFGYKCAEPGYPGVYSRVTSYIDWIKNNME